MPQNAFRVVLDTNIVVRAFIDTGSSSGLIFKACEQRRIVPLARFEIRRRREGRG